MLPGITNPATFDADYTDLKSLTMKTVFTLILSCVLSVVMAQQNGISRKVLKPALIDQKVKTVEIQEISFPAGQTLSEVPILSWRSPRLCHVVFAFCLPNS